MQLASDPVLGPNEHDLDAEIALGVDRAGDDRGGSVVAAHSVERNPRYRAHGRSIPTAERGASGSTVTLHVEIANAARVGLNETLTRRHTLPHEHVEHLVRLHSVVDVDTEDRARGRIHCRIPELLRVHLAKSLVSVHIGLAVAALLL